MVAHDGTHTVQVLWAGASGPSHGQIQPGDVLLSADQKAVTSAKDIANVLAAKHEVETVTLGLQRGKQQLSIVVTLARLFPSATRPVIVAGNFRTDNYNGTLTAFLDPVSHTCSGLVVGSGAGKLDGTCAGTWDPSSGTVQLTIQAKIKVLVKMSFNGQITGQIGSDGTGSGTIAGESAISSESGTWTCSVMQSPDYVGL